MPNNLTMTSAGYNASGKFSYSLNAGYGAGPTNLIPSGSFTVEAWVKVSSLSGLYVFIGEAYVCWVGIENGNVIAKYGSGGTEAAIATSTVIGDNAWHHVELTVDASTGGKLFVDGVLAGSSATTPASAGVNHSSGSVFIVRGNFAGVSTYNFPGEVDEVAVWSTARHSSGFTAPTSAYAGNEANLVALWHLDNNGNDSVSTDTTAPTLTSPTGTQTGTTTASGTVSTNEGNGTLYYLASTNATETAATVKAASSQAVSATGSQSVSFTGLTASTTYYAHYCHTDAAANDSTVSNSASFTTASPATAVTMSGPSGGVSGVASTNFTIGANGAITGTVIVTPSDSSGGGTFTPTTVSISSGTPTGTFTYTPASVGAKTVSVTNNGGLANPSSITYTATSATNNAYAPASILFSPYNWKAISGYAKTINAGAYFKTIFGGTACTLAFDMTGIASPVPQISYRVDGFGAWTTVDIAATVVVSMPSQTADYATKGGHFLEVIVKSTTETQPRWSTQSTAVVLTGVNLDTGKTLTLPPSLPLMGLYYGDSITEGVRTVNSTDTYDTGRNDAAQGWAYVTAQMLGAEAGIVGFGATGFVQSGSGGVPVLGSSYNYLWSAEARSFTPAPDYIVINEGTNDSSSVTTNATTVLNALIAATPKTCKIIVLRPFNGSRASEIVTAIAATTDPARISYIDTTGYFTTANSADSLHPYGNENITHIAPLIAAQIRALVAPQRGTRTLRSVSVTLVDSSNVARASLTGLKWAWYDQITPDLMTVAADQGTGETTDGSGVLTIPVYTTLASSGVGWLLVTDSDGTTATVHKAFSGPVTVT